MTTLVALVDLPALLADVVRDALASESDIEIEVLPSGSSPANILAAHPDVVLVGANDPEHYAGSAELLDHRPDLGLFAITPDAREAWIHELLPQARSLAEVSGPVLRAAVRGVADRAQR